MTTPSESSVVESHAPTAGAETAADSPLARDGWNAALAPQPPIDQADGYRWRHPELEALLEFPVDERPDLVAALKKGAEYSAINAAILLARTGDGRGRELLIETVRRTRARLPLRCAAAEALAHVRDPSPVADLRELIDRYGRFPSPAYLPELHAELLYGLAARVDAGTDERFVTAAKSPAAAARLAAIRGWVRPGEAKLAEVAADLRTDSDYRVRAAALAAMAERQHPLALEAARNALGDSRLDVRLAAIAALGQIGGAEAQYSLEKLERDPEVIRAAASVALGRLGAREQVWAGADSESWHVRRAVATALRAWPDTGGALLARRLLGDASVEVQKEVLVTLAAWPLDTAGPVLLEALGGPGYLSRKTAAAQLSERWPAAREFTVDAPPERRAEMLAHLRSEWSGQFGVASAVAGGESSDGSPAASPPGPERVKRAAALVLRLQEAPPDGGEAAATLRELADFGPDLPWVLEQLVVDDHVVLPDAIYLDVLPAYGGPFADLESLASHDVQERRRAANRLAVLAEQTPLSSLALTRLSELGASESDTLVWTGLFRAIQKDAREPSVRLAYAGLGHGMAEVRRLAAEYLGAHPDPQHGRLLVPALADSNYAVVLAAVKALGHPGMLQDASPLEGLLTTTDRPMRLAVANSLAILDSPQGLQALELLARDTDADTRRRAAQLMGSLGDRRYTETLISLLDDTLGVRTAALASLRQVVGRDVADEPGHPATSTLDQVERWRRWWHAEQSRPREPKPNGPR
ncbi:MAG TPA: HEAT repeat domain-containing protein [Pirellulales bacterium]|nr:HEAT repeat domain-containing protein [Pirellulales bacterium]